jgi:hypothetical protein
MKPLFYLQLEPQLDCREAKKKHPTILQLGYHFTIRLKENHQQRSTRPDADG